MGNRYVVHRANFTPTNGQDVITIDSAASRRVRLVEVRVVGLGSTSAAQILHIGTSTGGTTPPSASSAPTKYDHSDQPAAASTIYMGDWATEPTLSTYVAPIGWNAVGGMGVWRAIDNKGGFEARNGDAISIRAVGDCTYQVCTVEAVFEED